MGCRRCLRLPCSTLLVGGEEKGEGTPPEESTEVPLAASLLVVRRG
jgi:hypothetical protein